MYTMSPWPLPQLFQHGSSIVVLSSNLRLEHKITEAKEPSAFWPDGELPGRTSSISFRKCKLITKSQEILQSAFERFKASLFSEKFVPYKFFPHGVDFEPQLGNHGILVENITIEECRLPRVEPVSQEELDEVYSLQISEEGFVLIKIFSYLGGLHALNTLSQLFYTHSTDVNILYSPLVPVTIRDGPVFAHRGLNLDICRNRISPKDVMRSIEGMSFVKLNTLHLHASDSQSWPLDIPALPELALKGAYNQSQIWLEKDLQAVQKYGEERGVEVYLEIDMPGHTGSIAHAYPHLITAYDQRPWGPWAAQPPSGQLKLNSPIVREFISTLLRDLLPRSSRVSSTFHIGGDEFNSKVYELDENVKSSARETIRPLLQEFVDHVMSEVSAHSMTALAWEELLLDWDLKLPASTVLQTWRGHSSVAAIVSKGHRVIVGPCTHWYLDAGYGAWLDPDPENPKTPIKPPFTDWNGPYKSWRQVYCYDPLDGVEEKDKHLVVGGEAHLWGELTDGVNLDNMLWPRLAAAAEILWKGRGEVNEDVTRRLAMLRERMVGRGFAAAMVQMEWCLANPGGGRL